MSARTSIASAGRKERRTPLLPATVAILSGWIDEHGGPANAPLFTTTTGRALSRDAIERRIRVTVTIAAVSCPSLVTKRVTAHTMRHTAAMRLLHAGVDTTVIALWLGHEQIATTNIYIHADMTLKENAIAKVTPPETATQGRYHPPRRRARLPRRPPIMPIYQSDYSQGTSP